MRISLIIGFLILMKPVCGQLIELEPTVVAADRLFEQEEEEANGILLEGSAIVIDEEVLEKTSHNSLSDLLQTRAGVSFDSFFGNSSFASPRLRGFGENSQLRTLVTVDGLPINRGDLGLNSGARTPIANLGKVTVLRGGRSVRYGSGAVAGVIALETKRSDEAFGGSLEGTGGSDETFRQRLKLAGTIDGWGWTAQLENLTSDGYRENSAQQTASGSISILTPEAEWGENRLVFSASHSQFEDPGALFLAAFLENPRQSLQPDQDLEIETLEWSDQLKLNLSSDLDLALKGAGSITDQVFDFQGAISDGETRQWNGEVVLSRSGEEWSFETGARYRWSQLDFERSQSLGAGLDLQLADLTRETWGAFAIARWQPTSELSFSTGVSWDYYRLDGEANSPTDENNPLRNFTGGTDDNDYAFEFGVEYQLTDRTKLWARYDRSLRFPVLDEVAFFQGFESEPPFNTELRAERGQGVELGLAIEHEAGWNGSLTLFGQWMEDEIFFDAFANLNENLSETERLGVELQWDWKNDDWEFNLFYAATLARFRSGVDDGGRVPLVPRHSLSGSLTWHATESLSLGVEGSYLSSRLDGNDRGELGQLIQFSEVPERAIWNVSASWEANESLTFFCRVNNVFDEQFISSQFSDGIFPGAGRQALFGGRVRF